MRTKPEEKKAESSYTEDGRIFKNLDHVEFDKLPKLINGIRILALDNSNHLMDEKETFKLRIADPVRIMKFLFVIKTDWQYNLIHKSCPARWSELFEDETSSRLIHFQQLAGLDALILKGRFEVCGFAIGTINKFYEDDMDIDLRTKSLGCFIDRKLNGKTLQH